MNLKITSFNIRFANPADGAHDWPHRKDFLSQLILDFDCDILGTQEGRYPQLQELAELIGHYQLIDQHREWIQERMYPCLFVKSDKIFIQDSGDIWLSETPNVPGSKSFESAFPRLCTWGMALDHESKKQFLMVNTHLDHVQQKTRIEQAKVLTKEIKKINTEELPIILIGDFNDHPKSPVRETLVNDLNLKDPWFDKNKDEENSHHSFNGEEGQGDRIDWILLSSEFKCNHLYFDKSHREGIYPSDHYPLMSEIQLI